PAHAAAAPSLRSATVSRKLARPPARRPAERRGRTRRFPGRRRLHEAYHWGMSTTKDKTYGEEEIPAKLSEYGLDKWYYEDKWIRRKFNTDGWPTTLMAVNAVGYLCEAAGHHADLNVTWGKLWVKLATHS